MEVISMNKSIFIVDDKFLEIKSIVFHEGLLSIKTTNNCMLNIDLNFDFTTLKNGVRENISKRIYSDQNFVTEKYSYVIDIGNDVYLTKSNDYYLLEISISKIDILIPPFDILNNKRLESNNNYNKLEIHNLDAKIFFN